MKNQFQYDPAAARHIDSKADVTTEKRKEVPVLKELVSQSSKYCATDIRTSTRRAAS